jgi:hypothetical protein
MFQTMYTLREITIETLDTSFSDSNIYNAKIIIYVNLKVLCLSSVCCCGTLLQKMLNVLRLQQSIITHLGHLNAHI